MPGRKPRYTTGGGWLNDRMMVSPGVLEAVRQLFNRLDSRAIPNQEANDRCCHAAYQPN
jgi:hypothetical protein